MSYKRTRNENFYYFYGYVKGLQDSGKSLQEVFEIMDEDDICKLNEFYDELFADKDADTVQQMVVNTWFKFFQRSSL